MRLSSVDPTPDIKTAMLSMSAILAVERGE